MNLNNIRKFRTSLNLAIPCTLQAENTPSFSSFLALGKARTCAFFWLAHCCWLRPGLAGSLFPDAEPEFAFDPDVPLGCACCSRAWVEAWDAGSAITAPSSHNQPHFPPCFGKFIDANATFRSRLYTGTWRHATCALSPPSLGFVVPVVLELHQVNSSNGT